MDTFIHYGLAASIQAIRDAGLPTNDKLAGDEAERIGCLVSSGIGGLPLIEETKAELMARGPRPRRVTPFFVPASIINVIDLRPCRLDHGLRLPGAELGDRHGLHHRPALHRHGRPDDRARRRRRHDRRRLRRSTISPLGVGGFAAARALSTRNDDPATASRPGDKGSRWLHPRRRRGRRRSRGIRAREEARGQGLRRAWSASAWARTPST